MREPLTMSAGAMRDAVDAINQQFAKAARAAAERRDQPIAKKSTSRPTESEVRHFERLAEGRHSQREEQSERPLLLVPNVFNKYYDQRVNEGANWAQLREEPIYFGADEAVSLARDTDRMLGKTAAQDNAKRSLRYSRTDQPSTSEGSDSSNKRSASGIRKGGSIAQRIRSASTVRSAESLAVAGVSTRQLRQRSQQRQIEADLTRQLNEIADHNMSARLRQRVEVDTDENRDKNEDEVKVRDPKPRVKTSPKSESKPVSVVNSSQAAPSLRIRSPVGMVPMVDSREANSREVYTVEDIPPHWRTFQYDRSDPGSRMVRVNIRLHMENESQSRLIMLDPWSERSVSGLPPLANQVEIMAPNVFEYDEPQRVVSTLSLIHI